jgi:glycosyltransferase involved in cell wall biosynthesis
VFRNHIYYRIKPLFPQAMRFAIRRWFALRKLEQVKGSWPIQPGSETPPSNWPGWPGGKKFAVVLTHDVEGPAGLDKCRPLMELEKAHGFRSSFNFIPEGDYRVSPEFRSELKQEGFEVGVHDLYHDGQLYRNKADFTRNAARINEYLKEWGAVGFRSGFMLHNLEWLQDLNIRYDASTFDTDPFEPQPQGRNTIFPSWIPRTGFIKSQSVSSTLHSNGNGAGVTSTFNHSTLGQGYVELPYTLPQDSTLFLVLKERHPDIWFQKLDWIARNGGMALVNVHPDYLRFEGELPSYRNYPADFYARFLKYARQKYGDSFWHPLPHELAAFAAEHPAVQRPAPKRVCMVTYSYFMSDARVKRYAETLADRGDRVDVIALARSRQTPEPGTHPNVNVVNIQPRLGKNEVSQLSYLVPILRFLLTSSFWIARQHARKRYDLIHIHNVPDFLVFAAWYPKLTGTKVILDIHDIVPEFYASKFAAGKHSKAITLLKWVERLSARFADHVIISNHLWREKYALRTGANGKCSVFINNVDSKVFYSRPRTRKDGKLILLFPGGLQWHQGLDIAIRAFDKVVHEVPNAEFHIYGDGNMKRTLMALVTELGLDGKVLFFNPLPVNQVAEIMANADLGVVPKRADSFGNEAYSTKIMEFLSLGIPVVVSNTKIDRFYFDDSVVRFFQSGNETALAEAMLEVMRETDLRRKLVQNSRDYVSRNSWDTKRQEYLDLVDALPGTN